MLIGEFLTELDIEYERQLIKDPYDIDLWLQYYQSKHTNGLSKTQIESSIFVLTRALKYLNRSYKLWILLLELKVQHVKDTENVVKTFEIALQNDMHRFPLFWNMYLEYLVQRYTGSTASGKSDLTHFDFIKQKFNQSLQSLPIQLHQTYIWPLFLQFARTTNDFAIYKRFFHAKRALPELFKDPDYELIVEQLCSTAKEQDTSNLVAIFEAILHSPEIVATFANEFDLYWKYISVLVRFNLDSLDLVMRRSVEKFPDQRFKLVIRWANHYGAAGNHARAKEIFQDGIDQSESISEFSAVYEAYLEYEENLVETLMAQESKQNELDEEMSHFEELMNSRELKLNDIYLKQDPNNVETWLKRVKLFDKETQLKQVLETYVKLIMTIDPKKASKGLYRLWVDYVNVYETNGDLATARMILSKCVNVPFKDINDLVEVWLEWGNVELRNDSVEQLIKVLERVLMVENVAERDLAVNFSDSSLPPQSRIFKSYKLWCFYLDLVESTGDIDKTSSIYDSMIDLKIVKPITLINYAMFYEDNSMFEKSLAVFEKGLTMFQYPVLYEIWNIYLSKLLKFRKLVTIDSERIRDLFDECIDNCPMDNIHGVYLLYADFEDSMGNVARMMSIYKKALSNGKLNSDSKLVIYKAYITKAHKHLDDASLRQIYEQIINDEDLPLSPDLLNFVKDFVSLELRLKDLNRSRFILRNFYEIVNQSASQKNGVMLKDISDFWKLFELNNGDEESFKEMLRFRRICEVKYGKLESKVLEGFVKSSEGPKVSSINASETLQVNPDAIELSIDDDDDDDDDESQ